MTLEEQNIVNRLKATFADVDEMEQVFAIVTKALALREAELSMAKALCTRAADALESGHEGRTGLPYEEKPGCQLCDLIAELRKAAE